MSTGPELLDERLERVLKQSPELRRRAVELATKRMQALVLRNVAERVHDTHGNVARHQAMELGSKGGYGRVTPRGTPNGLNGPAAISVYLEQGHKTRKPKVNGAKGYRPRLHVAAVAGRFFYRAADAQTRSIALEAAKEVCEGIADMLEGGDA